jgi:hypothetical protein
MRRTLAVIAGVVALLSLVPAAYAQAPVPKVTIVGLFDQITSTGNNFYDGNYTHTSDREWYARSRFRPDFTFEVGRTKAVLGLEIDLVYGQTGPCGAGPGKTIVSPGGAGTAGAPCPGEKSGATAWGGLNTDVTGVIEIKWMYTEFDLTGKDALLPFIPVGTVARAGFQPFATIANYKIAYANGDFAGLDMYTTWAPNLKTHLAFVQVEEEVSGVNRLARNSIFRRGEDWAFIFSPEITPFKGLDIKPLFSYFSATGPTSSQARRAINNEQGAVAPTEENRFTVGFDGRFRSGPFSLDPTIYYQFGDRTQRTAAGSLEATMSSWLVDIIGGFQLGPLLLEARGIWSRGSDSKDDLRKHVRYFEPLDLDTSYYAGWAAILALGVDYFNGGGGANQGMDTNIGYDRYGRRQLGFRATYSLTPELAFYGVVSPTWADKKVDTDTNVVIGAVGGGGTGARNAPATATHGGDSRYIGTEVDLGTTWRFAPNTVFDLQGAYLFAGGALDTTEVLAGVANHRDSKDAWTVAARVRLSF